MSMGRRCAVHRDLGQLFEGRSIAGLGEVQLLERFVERGDEPAFAALVERHGPMVLGVCRRLLADPLDVEDAFQATFLVLVRRAGSLRRRDRLAPWLFGVARKVATRTRTDIARRRARECHGAEEIASTSGLDEPRRELGRALIEEIDRLPGPLRETVVLCCVEGLTYDEAAGRLRTTAPAIRGKLARGREILRDRLTRRGFAPSATALGALMSSEAVSAAIPHRMLIATIQLAKAGAFPAGVEALAEGVIQTMILTKSKILAVALVACGLAGTSVGLNAQDAPAPISATESELRARAEKADRFGQIEKKLDRLIEALEGSRRGQDPFAPVPTAAPSAAPSPGLPAPPAMDLPPPPPAAPLAPAPPAAPHGMMGMMGGRGMIATVPAPADQARLAAVERKLLSLEKRIANLERKLGQEDPAEGDSVTPAPAVIRPDAPARKGGSDVRSKNRATATSPFNLDTDAAAPK